MARKLPQPITFKEWARSKDIPNLHVMIGLILFFLSGCIITWLHYFKGFP